MKYSQKKNQLFAV